MKQYTRKLDASGDPYLETDLPGLMLTRLPLLNKGSTFTAEERRAFGLEGLFPAHVSSLEEQMMRAYHNFQGFRSNLDKHVYLRVLQDRSEVLFYALLEQHLEEMLPILYTPTVAEAVQEFSRIYRYPRGLVVSTETIDRIDELLGNVSFPDVQFIVATDSEGILGIGDQGFGGMAICIGKLSLYTAAAGIDPAVTLPVELDVGTNRQDLLDDPLYLGVRHERLVGQAYEDFIERFFTALEHRFPDVLLQWEDFSKQKAFDVLDRYRERVPSFNDDIQGTGAVVLAGLLAAARKTRRPLAEEVFLIHGAGAGGVGVARRIAAGLRREGLSEREARERIFVLDSRGLLLSGRDGLEPYKLEFAQDPARVAGWRLSGEVPSLLETIREGGVTAIIGLSGQRGAFDETVVRAVMANTPTPLVFALSNPTSSSEAIPEDVYRWSEGRAVVATGSPFDDVLHDGAHYPVGQGNNAFIFPGLGLGVLLSGARRVTHGTLTAAAVMRAAKAEGEARRDVPEEGLERFIEAHMWQARYLPIRRAGQPGKAAG